MAIYPYMPENFSDELRQDIELAGFSSPDHLLKLSILFGSMLDDP